MLAEWIIAGAGLALTVAAWALFLAWRKHDPAGLPSPQIRRVRVNGGYRPAEVHLSAGLPSRLIFRREETAPCSERVVIPDFGLNVALPPLEDISVELPASDPGEHEFTCQMEMLGGRIVVHRDPIRGRRSSVERPEAGTGLAPDASQVRGSYAASDTRKNEEDTR